MLWWSRQIEPRKTGEGHKMSITSAAARTGRAGGATPAHASSGAPASQGSTSTASGSAFDPTRFRDLRRDAAATVPSPPVRTGDLVVALARRMLEDLDRLTDEAVRRIRAAVQGYRTDAVVLRDDLWWSVYRNAELVLHLLVDERDPTEEELRVRRSLGARRAQQGLPVEDVLQAFHVGCLVLWEEITVLGEAEGQAATSQLLRRAGMVWTHMHRISSVVADAHRMELARRDALAHDGPAALLKALARWPADGEAVDLARHLGFDPEGPFLAAVHRGPTLSGWPAARAVVSHPDRVTVLCAAPGDAEEEEAALTLLLQASGAEAVGVGVVRGGLAGAKGSLADACRAHRAAAVLGRDRLTFRDGWFEAMAVESREHLAPVVAPAVALLEDDDELTATVEAYLRCGGRVAEAARSLGVHPNTVTYRIDRFVRRTGVDPRSTRGALAAQLALTLMAR